MYFSKRIRTLSLNSYKKYKMEKITKYNSIDELKAASSKSFKKNSKNALGNTSLKDLVLLLKKNEVSKTAAFKVVK